MSLKFLLGATALAALLVPAAASAQTVEPAQDAAQASQSTQLDEVVVTARRRAELISKVPVAVTAFNEEVLNNANITNLDGIRTVTPGLVATSSPVFRGTMVNFIRGQGETGTDQSSDPVVAVYVDGVYRPASTVAAFDLFDVEQVEVLRGAQGTLFGKNTTAGAMSIVTRGPGRELGGQVNVGYGSNERRQITAGFDFPLGDDWGLRLSGGKRLSDGDFTDGTNNTPAGAEDVSFGRAILAYRGDGPLTGRLALDYLTDGSDTPGTRMIPVPGFVQTNLQATLPQPVIPVSFEERPGLVYVPANSNFGQTNQFSAALNLDLDLGSFGTLSSVTGYFSIDSENTVDNSGLPNARFLSYHRIVERDQFSQEFRLSNQLGRLNLVSGVYYSIANVADINDLSGLLYGGAPYNVVGRSPVYKFQQEDTSAAAFTDGIFDLTDRLRVNFGARYSWQQKDFRSGVLCGTNIVLRDFSACQRVFPREADWRSFDPKIGVDFDLTDSLLLYAKYQTGFRSGGFNGRSQIGNVGPYRPEEVEAYEGGIKGRLWDNRASFSLVGFFNTYEDLQVLFVRSVPNPYPGAAIITDTATFNAAGMETKGVEFEASVDITDRLNIAGSLAYLDAHYKDFVIDTGRGIVDLTNNTPRFSPEWTGSVRATYEVPLGSLGNLRLNATASYSDSYQVYVNTSPGDLAATRSGSYTRIDATATWTSPDEKYEFQVSGRNINDAYYLLYGNSSGLGVFNTSAPPATYFAELKVKF